MKKIFKKLLERGGVKIFGTYPRITYLLCLILILTEPLPKTLPKSYKVCDSRPVQNILTNIFQGLMCTFTKISREAVETIPFLDACCSASSRASSLQSAVSEGAAPS